MQTKASFSWVAVAILEQFISSRDQLGKLGVGRFKSCVAEKGKESVGRRYWGHGFLPRVAVMGMLHVQNEAHGEAIVNPGSYAAVGALAGEDHGLHAPASPIFGSLRSTSPMWPLS